MKMKIIVLFITLFLIGSIYAQKPNILLRTGFEPTTNIVEDTYHISKYVGEDETYLPPNNWNLIAIEELLINHHINYGAGNESIRLAEIKEDPANPEINNKVLHYWILEPYQNGNEVKGRVQTDLFLENNSISELYYSARLFLPEGLEPLKDVNFSMGWFTLIEFWNNRGWGGDSLTFRVKLDIFKSLGSDKLRFRTSAQRYMNPGWLNIWQFTNNDFEIPLEEWIEFKVYYKEGNANNGKFKIKLKPENQNEFILFDIVGFTHHPLISNPTGLKHLQPLKLYTSEALINHVNNNNGFVNLYWDDFILCDKQGLDLHIKNAIDDVGIEPYNGSDYGISPDIWVRNQNDNIQSHQNPIYNEESPNYIYVRLHNKSCDASFENDNLKLYWSLTNTPQTWPSYWDGSINVNGILLGDLITTINIPRIPPGSYIILEIPWYPPNPKNYQTINIKPNAFSLLARIESNDDQMTFLEGEDVIQNVLNNNNISIRYLQVNSQNNLNGNIFKLYPNPVNNYINIEYNINTCEDNIFIRVLEISTGNINDFVLNRNSNQSCLDFSDFSKGVYEVLFFCNKILIESQKIIVY